jgi:hypothetical protein
MPTNSATLNTPLHRVDHYKANWPSQNLIPLLLRPLRLVLPSDRLRSLRIVLLKATHLPFVGAIWAYEQLVVSRKSTLSLSGPETPALNGRSLRPSTQPIRPLAGFQPPAEGNGRTPGRTHQASRPQTRSAPDAEPHLKLLVLKLTAQVEELTSIVSQLRDQREANTAA